MLRFSDTEKEELAALLHPLQQNHEIQRMKHYVQHGRISTYDHCRRVARISFWLNRRLHMHCAEEELIQGAMLHDFFLYDWHAEDGGTHRLHGFTHPHTALINARKYFRLTGKEEDIIANHMWPLTLRHIPRSREAFIVCAADKIGSAKETLFMR